MAKGRRSLAKKDDLDPGSHKASTVMVSPPLNKVRELVRWLGLPKLPRLTQLWVHRAACPSSSCSAHPVTCPKKVAGIGLGVCMLGALHRFVFVLHIVQKYFFDSWPSLR